MDEQDVRVEIIMNVLPFKLMYSIHTYRQYSLSVVYSTTFKFSTLQLTIRYVTPEEFFWIRKKCHIHLIYYASCLYLTYCQY